MTTFTVESTYRIPIYRQRSYHADRLAEMDVNPVIVLPKGQGVLALDAMIACDAPPADGP